MLKYREFDQPQIGDILLCKSFTPLGWAIGRSFRQCSPIRWVRGVAPSGHNGVLGTGRDSELCVFEALGCGFTPTPFVNYLADVNRGLREIKIARLPGLTYQEQRRGNKWLLDRVGSKYDYAAYWSLIWRVLLRLPPVRLIQDDARFYCTEAAEEFFRSLGHPFLPRPATPLDVEQELAKDTIKLIADCIAIP